MRKIVFVVMLVMLLPFLTLAQETAISDTLDVQLDGIEAWVESMRGLSPDTPVIRVFPSRAEVSEFLQTQLNDALTPDIVQESTVFYIAFDFIEPGIDIPTVYFELIEDQIGGYYDPETKLMNTILISGGELSDELPPLEQIIYAHEYVHALQDQVFDLQAIGLSDEGIETLPTDSILALQALVEGDATLVMSLYTEWLVSQRPLAALSILGSSLTGVGAVPAGTPPILIRELTFPYEDGMTFATALVRHGGWEALDAAFADPPTSTEQILHPERYINREEPIPVELADTTAVMGNTWEMVTEETLGEFYLRAYLDTQLMLPEAADAADGWGGDRYRTFENASGEVAFVLLLTHDALAARDNFVAGFEAFGALRAGEGAPREDGCWVTPADALCMVVNSGGDVVISRAPDANTARALVLSQ